MLDYTPDDGYTESGYIKAVSPIHGDFRFTYRPTLVEEQSILVDRYGKVKPEVYDQLCAKHLKAKLVTWSLVDRKGQGVPIELRTILQLKAALFTRLHNIVAGLGPSDIDPAWDQDRKDQVVDENLESAIGAGPVGAVRAARDEKNSVAG